MIIVRAPSDAAAKTAETALGTGAVFGVQASLAHRQGRYLVVRCAQAAGVMTLIAECAARSWTVLDYSAGAMSAAEAMATGELSAWVSGYLVGRGA